MPTLVQNCAAPRYRVALVRETAVETETYPLLQSARDAYNLAASILADEPREVLIAIDVDTQHRVIGWRMVTAGTISASLVSPREVFTGAYLNNAAAIVLAHNHPSGEPTPSADDRMLTLQLTTAARMLDIPILDHIVVGHGRYVSFVEAGLMEARW